MRNTQEDNRLIASLAVFRELYDSEKDVYGVISVFLAEIIKNNALYTFSLGEITSTLNKTFEFEIPPAVVNTALGRLDFIERQNGAYVVTNVNISKTIVDSKQNEISASNETIINNLFAYVEKEKKIKLSEDDRKIISHSFCSFLLDEHNGNQYIEFITAYILANESDEGFKKQLNQIREGVILYSGIKYNNDLNDIGTWRTELTIYIETEILFHLAGFNGELYETLVKDFFSYVTEINQKAGKRLIYLKYFREVKTEIDGFFTKAKHLVENSIPPNPKTTAMVSLVNGCKKPSDIVQKKSDFFSLLKIFHIEIDTYDKYFEPENHQYNAINHDIITNVSKEIGKDANEYLNPLNYIAIHRREANALNFENCKAILLTGNSITVRIAWNEGLKDKGQVPLATYLSFLTNKFWFKLNKGFGKSTLPKTFDIITKAQVVLSKVLNDSVGEKYDELNDQFKKGTITQDQVKSRILDLRNQAKKPEEIRNEIVLEVIHTITEDSLQKFIEDQYHFLQQAKNKDEENVDLKRQIELNKQAEAKLLIETKRQILNEKKMLLDTLLNQQKPLNRKAIEAYKNFKKMICAILIVYSLVVILGIFNYGWDKLEALTYIFFAIIPFLISSIYLIAFEKTINPIKYLLKRKELYFIETYNEFNFNYEKVNLTKNEIEDLKFEIENLEGASI